MLGIWNVLWQWEGGIPQSVVHFSRPVSCMRAVALLLLARVLTTACHNRNPAPVPVNNITPVEDNVRLYESTSSTSSSTYFLYFICSLASKWHCWVALLKLKYEKMLFKNSVRLKFSFIQWMSTQYMSLKRQHNFRIYISITRYILQVSSALIQFDNHDNCE